MLGYESWSYGDAFADVYDDWYADVSDVAATTEVLGRCAVAAGVDRPVLELGIGSGRLAVPLAERGLTVWGIDASTAMLERLAARPGGGRVRAVVGDMADPVGALGSVADAPPAFGLVACAFNTLFLLTSEEAQQRCLHGVAELLDHDGTFVVEAIVPALGAGAGVERVVEPRTIEVDRVVLTVSHHDPRRQLVTGQHIELRESGTRLRPWVLRYLHPAQLDALAEAAGLVLASRWAGWDRSPFDADSTAHVSMYRRRSRVRADT